MTRKLRVHQAPVGLLAIKQNENPYLERGWDLYTGRSHWGKWVSNSILFRLTGNLGLRFPMVHIWRSYQLCKDNT